MSQISFANPDFYLKQEILKPYDEPVQFLLHFRTQAEMLVDFDHYVFLQSHKSSHAVWQITDLDLSYLSPDVLHRLVTQRAPLALSLNELIAAAELPWAQQMEQVFGGSNSQIG